MSAAALVERDFAVPDIRCAGCIAKLEQGLLGDVVTRQVLERHLVPGFPEARKKALADWLALGDEFAARGVEVVLSSLALLEAEPDGPMH